MKGKKFIETIRLENILSYGPNSEPFPLEPLNVLIGPNASGKSNLIDALTLLAAAPRDLQAPIRESGGVAEWLWKGSTIGRPVIDVTIRDILRLFDQDPLLRYRISFTEVGGHFLMVEELIEGGNEGQTISEQPDLYYQFLRGGSSVIRARDTDQLRNLKQEDLSPDQSILSQRRDPDSYPQLTYLARRFAEMRFYREWNLGRNAPPRLPQRPDLYQAGLLGDASNLALVLSDLLNQPSVKEQVLDRMRDFYATFLDVTTTVIGGTVQIFFHEKGLRDAVPATRLSDGSLRYLCLLAVLCHPSPPPVVCIEEPELGLHPDIIPEVAKLLVEASSRTQIFVTTHSDVLVDALTDVPEAVVVCEKEDGATQLQRLDPDRLAHWLEKYRLGELWSRGQIGGNRW